MCILPKYVSCYHFKNTKKCVNVEKIPNLQEIVSCYIFLINMHTQLIV